MMQTTFKMQFDSLPLSPQNFLNKKSGWKFKFFNSETHKASKMFSLISSSLISRGLCGAKWMPAFIYLPFAIRLVTEIDRNKKLRSSSDRFISHFHRHCFKIEIGKKNHKSSCIEKVWEIYKKRGNKNTGFIYCI